MKTNTNGFHSKDILMKLQGKIESRCLKFFEKLFKNLLTNEIDHAIIIMSSGWLDRSSFFSPPFLYIILRVKPQDML